MDVPANATPAHIATHAQCEAELTILSLCRLQEAAAKYHTETPFPSALDAASDMGNLARLIAALTASANEYREAAERLKKAEAADAA